MRQPLRLAITVTGIALCVTLMLFLLSIYSGVSAGSVEYIRRSNTDLWVLQRNATNILRGSSILSSPQGNALRQIPGVASASPVLFLLSGIKLEGQQATMFVTGFDPTTGVGGPPQIKEGRTVRDEADIVLDECFAQKFKLQIGQSVRIQDDSFRVVGISSGTNAFVIQYAFVTIGAAQELIGFPNLVTCYLLRVDSSEDVAAVQQAIRAALPRLEVYDHATFLRNNIHEMETGILPLLYAVAAIGAVVLTAILSLLLVIGVLEQRRDFAVVKTLGAPPHFLPSVIATQALALSFAGSAVAVAGFFPLTALLSTLAPEVSTRISTLEVIVVCGAALALGLVSSLLAIQKLRRIYPLEAFA